MKHFWVQWVFWVSVVLWLPGFAQSFEPPKPPLFLKYIDKYKAELLGNESEEITLGMGVGNVPEVEIFRKDDMAQDSDQSFFADLSDRIKRWESLAMHASAESEVVAFAEDSRNSFVGSGRQLEKVSSVAGAQRDDLRTVVVGETEPLQERQAKQKCSGVFVHHVVPTYLLDLSGGLEKSQRIEMSPTEDRAGAGLGVCLKTRRMGDQYLWRHPKQEDGLRLVVQADGFVSVDLELVEELFGVGDDVVVFVPWNDMPVNVGQLVIEVDGRRLESSELQVVEGVGGAYVSLVLSSAGVHSLVLDAVDWSVSGKTVFVDGSLGLKTLVVFGGERRGYSDGDTVSVVTPEERSPTRVRYSDGCVSGNQQELVAEVVLDVNVCRHLFEVSDRMTQHKRLFAWMPLRGENPVYDVVGMDRFLDHVYEKLFGRLDQEKVWQSGPLLVVSVYGQEGMPMLRRIVQGPDGAVTSRVMRSYTMFQTIDGVPTFVFQDLRAGEYAVTFDGKRFHPFVFLKDRDVLITE